MPRPVEQKQTKVGALRAYNRQNHLSFDVAYHLQREALLADGVSFSVVDPSAPEVSAMSAEDQKAYSDAKKALGL